MGIATTTSSPRYAAPAGVVIISAPVTNAGSKCQNALFASINGSIDARTAPFITRQCTGALTGIRLAWKHWIML